MTSETQTRETVRTNHTLRASWPDLTKDQRAWELAKIALGPKAPWEKVIARAQEIKESL